MSGAARLPEIPPGLLERYGVAAPRYTSYPTAVDWRGNLDPATYTERLRQASAADAPLSIYVHVPFCERRCLFCGCNVVITKNHDRATPYLDDPEREISAAKAHAICRRKVTQYQWGGGTPTFLSEAEIERLHATITGAF